MNTTITNQSPIAVNGIFYFIDNNGYLTIDVHDGAENKQIRFVGEDAQTTVLTDEDVKAAEAYRAEVDELMADDKTEE